MSIQENLTRIHENIESIKKKHHITSNITLIAVSKKKPIQDIEKAIQSGQLIFGENRVQEAETKIPLINPSGIKWHFIGHLQKNKVKKAVELFNVIHSVDKLETAYEINKRCKDIGKVMSVFVQVNTTDETQKSGVLPNALEHLLNEIKDFTNIEIIGLMTMGLFTSVENEIRKPFALLNTLKESMITRFPFLKYLSMGMSGDYEIAIEEGATHIRVGTSIFGAREYALK